MSTTSLKKIAKNNLCALLSVRAIKAYHTHKYEAVFTPLDTLTIKNAILQSCNICFNSIKFYVCSCKSAKVIIGWNWNVLCKMKEFSVCVKLYSQVAGMFCQAKQKKTKNANCYSDMWAATNLMMIEYDWIFKAQILLPKVQAMEIKMDK